VLHAVAASETAAACPSCGVFSTVVKGQVSTSPRDIPYGDNRIMVRWTKIRWTRCELTRRWVRGSIRGTPGSSTWPAPSASPGKRRDHRGRKLDPEWANRRRLLRARERLSQSSFARMWNTIVDEDPLAQILSVWIAKEELNTLLSTVRTGGDPHLTRHRHPVARNQRLHPHRHHQRPHRGLQPPRQTGQTRRMRIQACPVKIEDDM
jgi:hypothetical protein